MRLLNLNYWLYRHVSRTKARVLYIYLPDHNFSLCIVGMISSKVFENLVKMNLLFRSNGEVHI
jgi:hypothetical protein